MRKVARRNWDKVNKDYYEKNSNIIFESNERLSFMYEFVDDFYYEFIKRVPEKYKYKLWYYIADNHSVFSEFKLESLSPEITKSFKDFHLKKISESYGVDLTEDIFTLTAIEQMDFLIKSRTLIPRKDVKRNWHGISFIYFGKNISFAAAIIQQVEEYKRLLNKEELSVDDSTKMDALSKYIFREIKCVMDRGEIRAFANALDLYDYFLVSSNLQYDRKKEEKRSIKDMILSLFI